MKTVQKAADVAVHAGSQLYTDAARSSRAVQGSVPECVTHTQKEYTRDGMYEHRAEWLLFLLKPPLWVFRSLNIVNPPRSLAFFQCLRTLHQRHACEQPALILQTA